MLAEGFLAAIGLLGWLIVEPELLIDLGLAAALTDSVSTVLFNANPLLKIDGYQIVKVSESLQISLFQNLTHQSWKPVLR